MIWLQILSESKINLFNWMSLIPDALILKGDPRVGVDDNMLEVNLQDVDGKGFIRFSRMKHFDPYSLTCDLEEISEQLIPMGKNIFSFSDALTVEFRHKDMRFLNDIFVYICTSGNWLVFNNQCIVFTNQSIFKILQENIDANWIDWA